MENKNVPSIRFKGFFDDWEQRKLIDNAEKVLDYRGKSPTKFGMEWGNEGYLVLSALNVKNGYIDKSIEAKYGSPELFERWMGDNRLVKGDVLFTTEAPLGNVAQVPDNKGYILNQRAVAFKASKVTDNNFFAQLLRSPIIQNILNSNSSGGTAKGIGMKEFAKISAHVPKLEEQQKIGLFFKQLDETITLQDRELELLKLTKKSFLQQLFPDSQQISPNIRFANYHEDWEQRKLGELAEFNPKSKLPEKFEYVDLESVVGTALIGHKTESIESAPSRAQRLAAYGDVFYQTVRPYQKNNYLYDLPYDNFVFSTGYAQMRPKNSGYFLLNLVQEEKFVNRVLERSTGTSYPAINSNDLSRLSVKVPVEKKEQTKIGTFFKQLDETITLQEEKLKKLKETKKSFLQKMFI
ncbi:restriction endonuclease subunit S [Vagococcus fluvialis]|uniref:restriction endonuclease subunit S n=1 Tax=Vagococcus fluvialis TaxID=2738 RepID=UPI003B59B8CC